MNKEKFPATVYMDGQCPVCAREISLIKRWDKHANLNFEDISGPDFDPEPTGRTLQTLHKQLHAQTADGAWVVGLEAVRLMYEAVGWKKIVAASRLPGIDAACRLGYAVFAKLRPYGSKAACAACKVAS